MFLSAVLFVLFFAGCWLYCLTDAVLTPAAEFPGLRKPAWIAAITVTFILGAIAWVIARQRWRAQCRVRASAAHAEALARHPANRSSSTPTGRGAIGPDDDPEFLLMLDRLIRGASDSGE